MKTLARVVVAISALMSLVALTSSAANAVTWHNSGDTVFTATSFANTLSATHANLSCPFGTATGTMAAAPFVGFVWPAATGTITWTGCTLGVTGYSIDCGYTLTASGWSASSPAVTSGTMDITCGVYLSTAKYCHVRGSLLFDYTNPSSAANHGVLSTTTGGDLTTTNGPAGTCPLGNTDRAHFSWLTFTTDTNIIGPIIVRTG